MKAIVAVLILFSFGIAANAQEIIAPPCYQHKFQDVVALAKRLHVKPSNGGSMTLHSCGGDYDLIKVINAVLDRLDKAEKRRYGN